MDLQNLIQSLVKLQIICLQIIELMQNQEMENERSLLFYHYEDKAHFMMSYNNNMDSLGTLAHEMGHAVHAHYITREQPLFHSNMGMPLANSI